jgi:molybdate transport system ATP-binding protein
MKLEVDIYKKLKEFDLKVAFQWESGCLGLMGASGSGKSMTLKCIAGIETPDRGRIVLNNQVLFDSEKQINLPPQKRKIGYLFQNYALFPNMNVTANIQSGLLAQKIKNPILTEKTNEMLQAFHLQSLEKRYPRQLSGGQKQRVALARLMVCKPELILLDEAFLALDAELKAQLQKELKEMLIRYEKPSILVSHDPKETDYLCQKIFKIYKGELKNDEE